MLQKCAIWLDLLAVPYEEIEGRDLLDLLIEWSYALKNANVFVLTDEDEADSTVQDEEGYESDSTLASDWIPYYYDDNGEDEFTGLCRDVFVSLSDFRSLGEHVLPQVDGAAEEESLNDEDLDT